MPSTEEEILAARIGPVEPLNGPVMLADYDPAWPTRFADIAAVVRNALGNTVVELAHVGSTSVPGLAAKPVIDMVLVVEDSADERTYVPLLEACGFVLHVREPDWFEHRLLKTPDIDGNLHVFSRGCEEVETVLLFRDRLRSHVDDRRLYEQTKRRLAARTWKYTQQYADAKSLVVNEILARARDASG